MIHVDCVNKLENCHIKQKPHSENNNLRIQSMKLYGKNEEKVGNDAF